MISIHPSSRKDYSTSAPLWAREKGVSNEDISDRKFDTVALAGAE
jgi:hypothetical protein